jgi:3-deoxy-manno-octulosonate cytidylyltransferase (CMP-KDO synthetase)
MSLKIFIPARYGSTRLPGKPLLPIAGIPLLKRVWAIGASVVGVENTIVTTDDDRVADFAATFGAKVVMTDPALLNGTMRVAAALEKLGDRPEHVVNLQGDAALTPPWVIRSLVEAMQKDPDVGFFTPATKMSKEATDVLKAAKAAGEAGGTTVTFDRDFNALYFSKSVIPFVRDGADIPVYRHIGLYGYRAEVLQRLVALPQGPLEQAEKLEQLRALENGIKTRIVVVDYKGRSHVGVDSENDRVRAEKLIEAEGELLPVYDGSFRYGA